MRFYKANILSRLIQFLHVPKRFVFPLNSLLQFAASTNISDTDKSLQQVEYTLYTSKMSSIAHLFS